MADSVINVAVVLGAVALAVGVAIYGPRHTWECMQEAWRVFTHPFRW